MSSQFLDQSAPSNQAALLKRPHELPHGLIAPPQRVLELLAKEKAKFPDQVFNSDAEQKLLNEWTLQYFFDFLGHEVLYRQTSEGPDVLAVGFEEACARTNGMDPEAMKGLRTWMPG